MVSFPSVPSLLSLSLATLSPRSQLRTCKFPPLPFPLSLSLSPFPILTMPMKPWSASFPPVSCPSLSLQHFTLAVWDAGWSGEGRYGARCPSGLTVLIHPLSAPLPPDLPSHSSPLPRCGTGHRVEWRREAWSRRCKSGLVVVTMAWLWLWLWPEGRGVGCWVSEGCVH